MDKNIKFQHFALTQEVRAEIKIRRRFVYGWQGSQGQANPR